jgi:hypothetical protein
VTQGHSARSARIAWFATLGARTERDRSAPPISLPPPEHVRAVRGRRALRRSVTLRIEGLRPGTYELRHHRVDARHSNITRTWKRLGRPDWPDDEGWERLRAADHLEMLQRVRTLHAKRGRLKLEFELPMPAISLVELVLLGRWDHRVARP